MRLEIRLTLLLLKGASCSQPSHLPFARLRTVAPGDLFCEPVNTTKEITKTTTKMMKKTLLILALGTSTLALSLIAFPHHARKLSAGILNAREAILSRPKHVLGA
jgi:hypothetical protein